MASPKSYKDISAVSPAAPTEANAADTADPGEVTKIKAEQRQTQTGKYGSTPVEFHKASGGSTTSEEQKTSWIEIELVGEDDKPIPSEEYKITLSDGKVITGTLDEKGFARRDGIPPGNCKVTFPRLDKDAWKKA
jgi:hypothetical protein